MISGRNERATEKTKKNERKKRERVRRKVE